jgi:group I intron endonuclease
MQGIVYKITNVFNNKCYIGVTKNIIEDRVKQHIYISKNSKSNHFYNSLRKYGIENFTIKIIDYAFNSCELALKEQYYIKLYKSYLEKFGYNATLGGEGYGIGSTPNIETCFKMSKTRKERKLAKGKNNGMFGKGYLLEKENNGMYNKHHSEESKNKMSKTLNINGSHKKERNGMFGKGSDRTGSKNIRYIKLDYLLIVDLYFLLKKGSSIIALEYSKLKNIKISCIPIQRALKELNLPFIHRGKGLYKKNIIFFENSKKEDYYTLAKELIKN